MRILVVEDEEQIRKLMKFNLELEGYQVDEAIDGKQAMEMIGEGGYELIVLDLMLPYIDGLEICKQIRSTDSQTRIIIVSARDSVQDRVLGLKLGADDYLSKPFDLEEFLLRVNNLTRRQLSQEEPLMDAYNFGQNHILFSDYSASTANGIIHLTPKEMLLLRMFAENSGQVITRKQILQKVWGYDVYPSTRTIDNFVLAFRKYFEPNPRDPVYFHTIRGVGYKFTPAF
ncbi:MAG: response regulator transcription factor [Saprospiraceae bacterium]|nr:response regulator transcription factor [Saprospiraceae bacterium]